MGSTSGNGRCLKTSPIDRAPWARQRSAEARHTLICWAFAAIYPQNGRTALLGVSPSVLAFIGVGWYPMPGLLF